MAVQQRGGVPRVFRASIPIGPGGYDAAGHRFPAASTYVQIANEGSNALHVYFTAEDYAADANYLLVAAGGQKEGPMELDVIWLSGVGGATTAAIVSYARRG